MSRRTIPAILAAIRTQRGEHELSGEVLIAAQHAHVRSSTVLGSLMIELREALAEEGVDVNELTS